MRINRFLVVFWIASCCRFFDLSAEPSYFYEKNLAQPSSEKEQMFVRFSQESLSKAMKGISSLKSLAPPVDKSFMGQPWHHLLNNLCSLNGAAHLHIGLEHGRSFVAALYKNETTLAEAVGIDLESNRLIEGRCRQYLKGGYKIINQDCFSIDLSVFKHPIDVYLYDAGHTKEDQRDAFTYYNGALADVFVTIVDDWMFDQVREGTFQAFDELNYSVLYQDTIPSGDAFGSGQYLAVIKKNICD